jgi:electron transfer flavoprotein alpha subunit
VTTLVFATEASLYPELVTAANQRADGDVVALALGPLADEADDLAPGADRTLTAGGDGLDDVLVSDVKDALAEVADDVGADAVFVGGNRRGKEIAPMLAADLEVGYFASALELPDGTFKRKYLGGRTLATEEPTTDRVVATIAPHSFDPATGDAPSPEAVDVAGGKGRVERVKLEAESDEGVDIEDAEIVVAFGRGVKEEDDMEQIFDLAEALGGEVGCSRPISADLGWLGDDRWIGLSGNVVTPRLYIACGISGQIQHLSGCRDSETIVVINTDKNAPFFEHADYGIVGDLYEVVPALTELAE